LDGNFHPIFQEDWVPLVMVWSKDWFTINKTSFLWSQNFGGMRNPLADFVNASDVKIDYREKNSRISGKT
jgi:hypothetical protein